MLLKSAWNTKNRKFCEFNQREITVILLGVKENCLSVWSFFLNNLLLQWILSVKVFVTVTVTCQAKWEYEKTRLIGMWNTYLSTFVSALPRHLDFFEVLEGVSPLIQKDFFSSNWLVWTPWESSRSHVSHWPTQTSCETLWSQIMMWMGVKLTGGGLTTAL